VRCGLGWSAGWKCAGRERERFLKFLRVRGGFEFCRCWAGADKKFQPPQDSTSDTQIRTASQKSAAKQKSSVEVLGSECSLYSNSLVHSCFYLMWERRSRNSFFSTAPLVIPIQEVQILRTSPFRGFKGVGRLFSKEGSTVDFSWESTP